jgi:hypothetical protein
MAGPFRIPPFLLDYSCVWTKVIRTATASERPSLDIGHARSIQLARIPPWHCPEVATEPTCECAIGSPPSVAVGLKPTPAAHLSLAPRNGTAGGRRSRCEGEKSRGRRTVRGAARLSRQGVSDGVPGSGFTSSIESGRVLFMPARGSSDSSRSGVAGAVADDSVAAGVLRWPCSQPVAMAANVAKRYAMRGLAMGVTLHAAAPGSYLSAPLHQVGTIHRRTWAYR